MHFPGHLIKRTRQCKNLKLFDLLEDIIKGISTPQTKISSNLIISASCSVKHLSRLTNKISKCFFNFRTNILPITPPYKFTCLYTPLYLIKTLWNTISILYTD